MKKSPMVLLSLFLSLIFGASISMAYKLETSESSALLHWSTNAFPVKYDELVTNMRDSSS